MTQLRRQRVRRNRGGFQPPHCPNPACRFHRPHPDWHYIRDGHFIRPSDQRRFQVFRCKSCGRYFSARTFSTTYWLRRRKLLRQIAEWSNEAPGLRQMGRVLHASPTTFARHLARLGRHCLLFHSQIATALRSGVVTEPMVIDGFESFEYSQYFPFHLNLALGRHSHFIYSFNEAPLRRKGSMKPKQRTERERLESIYGRPDPKAVEKSFAALVREILAFCRADRRLTLHTDDHPAYRRGLTRSPELKARIDHQVTPSRIPRTMFNPLFPVNLADLLLRHSQANHRRETIAFSKERQAACERAAIFMVWRNYIKRWSEKESETTAAMRAGLLRRPLRWREVLRGRIFHAHCELSDVWRAIYVRGIRTVIYGERQASHVCRYAF